MFTWANIIDIFALPASAVCTVKCGQNSTTETTTCKATKWTYTKGAASNKQLICYPGWFNITTATEIGAPFTVKHYTCDEQTNEKPCSKNDPAKTCKTQKSNPVCTVLGPIPQNTPPNTIPFGYSPDFACYQGTTKDEINIECKCTP